MVTCKKCGWVHFPITRKEAEKSVKRFNEYFFNLSMTQQIEYYGGKLSTIAEYEKCGCCGGSYKNFRRAKKGDCPDGSTIGSIIRKQD